MEWGRRSDDETGNSGGGAKKFSPMVGVEAQSGIGTLYSPQVHTARGREHRHILPAFEEVTKVPGDICRL